MRKIKLQVRITIDGFVSAPNGEEDWDLMPDPEVWELVNELPDSSDTLLLGRKMAENFIPHFESFEAENPRYAFAQKMVNIPKVIFSKTLDQPFGKNTKLAKGKLTDEIANLKNQTGKDILVYGGASFVSALIAGGHIDEFYFLVIPEMRFEGIRIFDLLEKRQKLTLLEAKPFENGISLLHYQLKKDI
ncbi:dihydrofolate reductase [Lacihabitans sp. LS3-19]|uniref:dihydrofolate reductase family protein n=1 Tax=Lacihabitans sp. LS3-19 TaxID=2487335 RepID=UPI0020CE44DB|nr:dihydrofolate reductase family protein [Lacihabitans sp. LS3-19]MCP9768568.1 dihydrofolate reductase [Lacihabitans sp. LS3-19]